VPVIALRANETYSRLVRLSQMSSGMIPYSPAGEIRASSADEAGSCWPGAGARAFEGGRWCACRAGIGRGAVGRESGGMIREEGCNHRWLRATGSAAR